MPGDARPTHCNTLQHTATHCNTLQHTATTRCVALQSDTLFWERTTLQHTATTHCNITLHYTAIWYALFTAGCTHTARVVLQHETEEVPSLQHAATRHCNALQQRTATHCNLTCPPRHRMRACSLLSCDSIATHCNNAAIRTAATHCNNALQQHSATIHSNLTRPQHLRRARSPCVAAWDWRHATPQHTAITHCSNTLQHTATCLGARHAATRCNTLQQAATHCNLTRPPHIRMRARVLLSCYSTATHCNNTASAREQLMKLRLGVCVLVDKVYCILCVHILCGIVRIVL